MRLSLSIGDVDSYNMLFYAHYLRFCERAANECLPAGGRAYATLSRAELVKYSSSVKWNDDVEIRSTRVPAAEGAPAADDQQMLLHEWICGGKAVHVCLATYTLHGGGSFSGAEATDDPGAQRRAKALQRESLQLFTPDPHSYKREQLRVWPDMVGPRGSLGRPTVLDLMERQRTEIIGGQAELERLKAEDGVMIVVYSMQQFRLHGTPVAPCDTIEVSAGVVVQNDMFCERSRTHLRALAPTHHRPQPPPPPLPTPPTPPTPPTSRLTR